MTKGSRLFKVGSGAKLITGSFKVFFTLLSPKFAMIVICEFACIFLVPMPKISLWNLSIFTFTLKSGVSSTTAISRFASSAVIAFFIQASSAELVEMRLVISPSEFFSTPIVILSSLRSLTLRLIFRPRMPLLTLFCAGRSIVVFVAQAENITATTAAKNKLKIFFIYCPLKSFANFSRFFREF